MPSFTVVTRDGAEHVISSPVGASIMEALRDAGTGELMAVCGGCCSCATCHVYVDMCPIELPAASEDETELLDGLDHRRSLSRLSCQIIIDPQLDGLRITIAPDE